MTDIEINVHRLDAAYKPFPTFEEWSSKTSVDTVRWDRYNASVRERSQGHPEALARARQIATRAAAIDTGAIENLYEADRGFTYTVAFQTAAWESEIAAKGEQVRPLFEAQLQGYEFVLSLATGSEPISEAAIRELHVQMCAAQDTYRVMTTVGPQEQPLPKGQYKSLPNHVRTRAGENHSYAPVDVTPEEMYRLIGELRTDAFLAAHPIIQAAYVHYCFVAIHPFADGNGRVARALASAFTYRAISIPVLILVEQKTGYLDALGDADVGNFQAFVKFMLDRAVDTVMLVEESFQSSLSPNLETSLAGLERLYAPQTEFTERQVDNAGLELLKLVESSINSKIKEVRDLLKELPILGSASTSDSVYDLSDSAYRLPFGIGKIVRVSLATGGYASAQVGRAYGLWCPGNPDGFYDMKLVNTLTSEDDFLVRIDELIPEIASPLRIRVSIFAERIIRELIGELQSRAERKFWG